MTAIIKNEADWLRQIQESQKEYEEARRKIENQRKDIEAETNKVKENFEELIQLQMAVAEEMGRVMQAKEEARNQPVVNKGGSPMVTVEAEQADPTLPILSRGHSRVTSVTSQGQSSDDEDSSTAASPAAAEPPMLEVVDNAVNVIPVATLVASFPYRVMDKIGKKISSRTIIGNKYEVKSADDMKSALKTFAKLRCIKRVTIQTTPVHRAPIQIAEKTDNDASVSALVYKKRLADLRKTLQKSAPKGSTHVIKGPEYKTRASISLFVTDALSDDQATNQSKTCNVVCAFRFRLQAVDGRQITGEMTPHLTTLDTLLGRWSKFAEARLNTQMKKNKHPDHAKAPSFKCELSRLPGMGTGVGYEVLWKFNDQELETDPTQMKSDAVIRDEQFRHLLTNLTGMMLVASGQLLEQHKGTVESKMDSATDDVPEFVDGEMVNKAKSVFVEVLTIHQQMTQLYNTSNGKQSPEFTLLHRRVYLLLCCLAHHKSYVELIGTIGWDTDICASPKDERHASGPAAKTYEAFDISDVFKIMSPASGQSTSDVALKRWNKSGQKVFENISEFLTPVLRYFQIDDPRHPKDSLYESAHLQFDMVNVPHACLNAIHKLIEYRTEGIVLSRIETDEFGQERKIKGRMPKNKSMFSTKSKVALGLTFYDEMHFDVRRPRPMDQQNGIDNESLIEERISRKMEETEAQTQERIQEMRAQIAEETEGDGSAKFSKAKKLIDGTVQDANELAEENADDIEEGKKLMEELEAWSKAEPRMTCTAMRVIVPVLAPRTNGDLYQPPAKYLNFRWTLDNINVAPQIGKMQPAPQPVKKK